MWLVRERFYQTPSPDVATVDVSLVHDSSSLDAKKTRCIDNDVLANHQFFFYHRIFY